MQNYRTALILGYGRSGQAAERMLNAEGCLTVVLSQDGSNDPQVSQTLEKQAFEICIVSPGFSLAHPWLCAIRAAGIPLLSELELGWSRHRGKTVAVTGSNGKSTAVKWICESLQLAQQKAAIGGNYGIPACEVVLHNPDLDWLVLEISSFQLETVRDFRADVAVLLNVLPNHLDRHKTMAGYRQIKMRIFAPHFSSEEVCLIPFDLLETCKAEVKSDRNWRTFGTNSSADYRFENGTVFHEKKALLNLSGTLFDSPTLGGCTGAAVAGVLEACQVAVESGKQAAKIFKSLPHRIQRLGRIDGVDYVNDSKATNLAATVVALQAVGKNIHLIAGGIPKESDYTFVKEVLAERVRSLYLIGQASQFMYHAWNEVCLCVKFGTLEGAFNAAKNAAKAGDTILLSPGCASFDQFRSFEERGERFMELFENAMQTDEDVS